MRRLLLLVLLTPVLADGYGFRGFEIYKVSDQMRQPLARDLDGDGILDLLIANNDRAKIEVFLRRRDKVPPKKSAAEKLPNDLLDDQYYERGEILTEMQVWSLDAGDLNGDGHADVAYYGKPEALVVAFGDGKGAFPETKVFPVTDGAFSSDIISIGDLNGDGRADLVLLGKNATSLYFQNPDGKLAEPVKLPHAVKDIDGVLVRDVDGDGRADLILLNSKSERGLRLRYQRPDGSLGAEIALETSPWRTLALADLDPAPGLEILVVQRNSGVMRTLRIKKKQEKALLGQPEIHAFEEARGGKSRSMALGDVDGDGRMDLVVTEPGTAQVALYRQDEKGGLRGRQLFGSLSNSEDVAVADMDGDGHAEVLVLSSSEKTVGVSSWKNGNLPFPSLLDVPGTPKAMDVGDLDGNGTQDLALLVEPEKKKWQLLLHTKGLGEAPQVVELEGLKQAPEELMVMDIDQDGRPDLLLFDPYDAMRVLRSKGDGGYEDLSLKGTSYRGGLVTGLSRGNVSAADVDGDGKPELLAASKNFARAIVCGPDGALSVKDQANGATPRSLVQGATALDLDGDGKPEVVLFDKEEKTVTVLKRDESGVLQPAENLPAGDLAYQALGVADLDGDGGADLVLFGKELFAVVPARGATRELSELHTGESTIEDASLGQFAVGDLNGDGRPDVAVLDRGRSVQIFSYDPQAGFGEQIRWDIFEKKMHDERRQGGGAYSPLIADLDGDGKPDLAVLVHDRLLVYTQ